MSQQTALEKVKAALTSIGSVTVKHYFGTGIPAPYIIWAEESEDDHFAGDGHEDGATTGTIDLFTQTEYDPLKKQVETALDAAGIAWYLNSTQYEDETGLIHHEWVWSVEDG